MKKETDWTIADKYDDTYGLAFAYTKKAYNAKNNHAKKAKAAYEALLGWRDDVYPCREDVPSHLWGEPIVKED